MRITTKQSGFSAVELLITLFIAAAFLISGYQLYSAVIVSSGETRMQLLANNVVTEYLEEYKTKATNPCSAVTPLPTDESITKSGLSDVKVTVSITCPYGTGTGSISKVMVSLSYGNPQKIIKNATYVGP